MTNKEDIFEKARKEDEEIREDAVNIVRSFIEFEGEPLTFDEAIDKVVGSLDVTRTWARNIVTHLATDAVDPVINVNTEEERYVFVSEFFDGDWYYGYEDFHDNHGPGKKVVCRQCIKENNHVKDIGRAFEHDFEEDDLDYEDLSGWLKEKHYDRKHTETDVEGVPDVIGASLASGTTINSNTAWHNGNVSGGTNVTIGSQSVSLSNDSVSVAGNSVALGGSTSVAHGDLSDAPSSAHHSKTSSASELSDVSADSNSSAHHAKYTDANARSAIESGDVTYVRGDGDLEIYFDSGNDRIEFQDGNSNRKEGLFERVYLDNTGSWFDGGHGSLGGVGSSDHHSKTSQASELSDVSPDSTTDAHHAKTTSGDITLENASANSTDTSQVFQPDGAGGVQTGAKGGGATTLIDTKSPSGVSSVDFTTGIGSNHRVYIFYLTNVSVSEDGAKLFARASTDGGSTFISTSDYNNVLDWLSDGSNGTDTGFTDDIALCTTDPNGNIYSSTPGLSGRLTMENPTTSTNKQFRLETTFEGYQDAHWHVDGSVLLNEGNAIDAIRFEVDSGNISSGEIELIGIN